MSILIKGMEMPQCCGYCPFEYKKYCMAKPSLMVESADRHPRCPLVPIPPHGDLIERDDLRASIRESIEECQKWADEVDKDTMMYARISQSIGTFVECSLRAKAAPTIIEAEEGE